MQSSSWLFVVFVALTGIQSGNAASQCSSVATCYAGGASSTPCTISDGGCPPCVTFSDDGCYVKVNGACPFGSDCTSAWAEGSTSTSDTSTTPSSTSTKSDDSTTSTDMKTPSTSTTTPSTTSTSPSTPAESAPTSSSDTNDTTDVSSNSTSSSSSDSGDLAAGKPSTGSSDMSVVFAIIGAAIGVIAVAVIFLTLVRRSNAAHDEDEDDISNTPPAFSKGPMVHTSQNPTGAATYSSYNRTPGMGSGTGDDIGMEASKGGVSMNAVSYYNQQPMHSSAAPSPHVAGRAIPSQPVGMNASSNMARPYGGSQNFGVTGVGVTSGFGTSGFGQSGVGVNNQAPPTPVQHLPMGGVTPSPHSRRESYEF